MTEPDLPTIEALILEHNRATWRVQRRLAAAKRIRRAHVRRRFAVVVAITLAAMAVHSAIFSVINGEGNWFTPAALVFNVFLYAYIARVENRTIRENQETLNATQD